MNDDVVVIVRLNTGEDLIAILHGELDNKIKLEHPYFVKYSAAQGTVGMLPYCALSDETFYDIGRSRIEFVVLANEDISGKFLATLDISPEVVAPKEVKSYIEEETSALDEIRSRYIVGNTTKH